MGCGGMSGSIADAGWQPRTPTRGGRAVRGNVATTDGMLDMPAAGRTLCHSAEREQQGRSDKSREYFHLRPREQYDRGRLYLTGEGGANRARQFRFSALERILYRRVIPEGRFRANGRCASAAGSALR